MEIIERKIKEKFGKKSVFCEKHGHKPKDFASKLNTLRNKIKWVEKFINPLGLIIEIKEK